MAERQAWFCPACQKHHAPHCDSCPNPTVEVRAIPGVNVWPARTTSPHLPDAPADPWVLPHWPNVTCGGTSLVSDPNMILINGAH